MEHLLFDTQKPATLEAVRELRHHLERVLLDAVPYPPMRQRILLCLSEAVTNLVLHAKPKATHITTRFGRDELIWYLEILDDGAPWNLTEHKHSHILSGFELTVNGRGAGILHAQCDQMEYNSGNGTQLNRLRLVWTTSKQKQRATILIVEDDNALRKLYTLYLDHRFEILTASNGHEALKKIITKKVDLVLSDINMPEMSGLSLREELNQKRDTDIIPFIFLTAFDNDSIKKHASDLGIDDYLVKPIDKSQLINTIDRVLERSRQIYQQLTDRIDKSITTSLSPSLPNQSHNWRLSISTRNTGIGGGDLLLHKLDENSLQFVLADIMGHDDSAKFFAHACSGYLHGLLQSQSKITDENSVQLLEQLSEFAMQDELMSKITLTCCSAVLSPAGKICLASAGHPPPLRISKTGIKFVPVVGVLPGLLQDATYQSETLHITVGERIAFYSDGLFESAADGNLRWQLEDRIISALSETLSLPIDQALSIVMETFDQFAGSPPKDDVLLLLMEPII